MKEKLLHLSKNKKLKDRIKSNKKIIQQKEELYKLMSSLRKELLWHAMKHLFMITLSKNPVQRDVCV